MPLPLILAVAGGLALLGIGAVVVLNWSHIVLALRGKKLAVLGARAVGKTSLIQFLTTGSISERYEPTREGVKTSGKRFQLEELKLDIQSSVDVSGAEDRYRDWHSVARDADIVLYLTRLDHLRGTDPHWKDRIRADIGQISRWLDERPSRPPFWVVVTHCDLDPSFELLTQEEKTAFLDSLRNHSLIQEVERRGRNGGAGGVVFGSLRASDHAEVLVADWLRAAAGQDA